MVTYQRCLQQQSLSGGAVDFLDLVWIRLFRPVRAIAEPWDERDGIEWAKMAVDRVTWQWLFGIPTPALCRGRLPSHWRPPLPGGGSRAATYPVADSHQARVNDGRTEERGTVIQRINRDLGAVASPVLFIGAGRGPMKTPLPSPGWNESALRRPINLQPTAITSDDEPQGNGLVHPHPSVWGRVTCVM